MANRKSLLLLGSSLALLAALALLNLLDGLGSERDELGSTGEVLAQRLGNLDTLGGLEVLEDSADGAGGGGQGGVEAVDVGLLDVGLLLDAKADLEVAGLVVGAVGARDELLELALVGEPSLEIELLGGRVVEGARDDGDDAVRDAERLVEGLRVGDHVVEHLPRLLGLGDAELLDLGELVDAEDAPDILAMGTGLLAEASGITGVLQGEVLGLEPLVAVEGGDGLLGGLLHTHNSISISVVIPVTKGAGATHSNQVLVGLVTGNLIELLVELGKLGSLGHLFPEHELGSLEGSVLPLGEELEAVVDDGLVEENTPLLQEVAAVADNLDTTLGVIAIQLPENLVVYNIQPLSVSLVLYVRVFVGAN